MGAKTEAKALGPVTPDAQDTESQSWLQEIFGARPSVTGVSVTPASSG